MTSAIFSDFLTPSLPSESLVTVKNQRILFLLSPFGGPPSPTSYMEAPKTRKPPLQIFRVKGYMNLALQVQVITFVSSIRTCDMFDASVAFSASTALGSSMVAIIVQTTSARQL